MAKIVHLAALLHVFRYPYSYFLFQADVSAACRSADSDQLILKPYQLVGVNFLMLLHRKNVGGGMLFFIVIMLREILRLVGEQGMFGESFLNYCCGCS